MKKGWKERLLDAINGGDKKAALEAIEEAPEAGAATHVHVHVSDKNPESGEANEKGEKEGTKGKPDGKVADTEDRGHRMTDSELDSRFKKIEDTLDKVVKALDKKAKDEKEESEEEEEKEVNEREGGKDKKKAKDAEEEEESEEKEEEEVNKRESAEDKKKKKAKDAAISAELPPNTKRTEDSVCLEAVYAQAVSLAEILKPGIEAPKFDKKALATKTYDSICNLRRSALEEAAKDESLKQTLAEMLNGRSVRDAMCGEVRTAFHAVAALKKRMNNEINTARRTGDNHLKAAGGQKVMTAAEMNKANAEFWSKQA